MITPANNAGVMNTFMMNAKKPPLMTTRPGQKLYWEFVNPADGRIFYYDTERQIS